MEQDRITFEHRGRRTIIHTPLRVEGLEKFKDGLKEKGFIISQDRAVRGVHPSTNDWPILITFSVHADFFELTASMHIPWGWFVANALAVILVPPVLWYVLFPMETAFFVECTVLYLLVVTGICHLIFRRKGAAPRHVFNLSPQDSWQTVPRKKWNRIIKDLLQNTFCAVVDEIEQGMPDCCPPGA